VENFFLKKQLSSLPSGVKKLAIQAKIEMNEAADNPLIAADRGDKWLGTISNYSDPSLKTQSL